MRTAGFALLLAITLGLAACSKATEPKPEEIRPVRVLKMDSAPGGRSIELAGEVRPRFETRLGFRVGGKMVARLVDVGSIVRAGQPIARLDPVDLQLAAESAKTQIAQIEAERRFAEGDLRRYRELREKNFISQAELDRRASTYESITARLEAARAQSRQAANQAAYSVLFADSAGVITAVEAEAGQVVSAGQTVARLARSGGIEIVVAVPESHRASFERARTFSVSLNAMPGRLWKGNLREMSPAADPVTRTYAAKVTVIQPGDEVELGMSARVSATVGETAQRMELPVSALYGKGETIQVWVVESVRDGIGSVRLQPVKTAGLTGDRVLIESGLAPGDVVVVAGAQLLRAGQRVRPSSPG